MYESSSAIRSGSLAGGARQQPSWHCGCTRGTAPRASTRIAPHWTSQRHPTHNDDAAARRHRAPRSLGRARMRRTSAGHVSASEPCIRARPAPTRCPQPFLQASARRQAGRAARLTGDLRTGGRTTRSPLHGCLPPPSKGGSRGPGRGRTPAPAHHLAPGTSNCEPSVPLKGQDLHDKLPELKIYLRARGLRRYIS